MLMIVELSGGLGNQLFQYAFGRSLTLETGCVVKFDARGYPDSRGRTFDLPLLRLDCIVASDSECDRLLRQRLSLLARVGRRIGLPLQTHRPPTCIIFREKQWFEFDPNVYKRCGNAYFSGYWQCLQYFDRNRGLFFDELRPRGELSAAAMNLSDRIQASRSVSVHIRRGDYRSPPDGNDMWNVCDHQYYQNALTALQRHEDDLTYFVFSDEPSELDGKLFSGQVHIVPENISAMESLYLMSQCRHHIIANSSFSWWGAYMSSAVGGMTIYPSRWTREMLTPIGLIPSAWTAAEAFVE